MGVATRAESTRSLGGEAMRGATVAAVLAGAWRREPLPLAVTPAQLDLVAPVLLGTDSGALGWWRVRKSGLRNSRPARALRNAYLTDAVAAGGAEAHLKEVFSCLRAVNVEPILIKGWSVARHYPEPGLRPYCDIDVCVQPEQMPAAKGALAPKNWAGVELHEGVPDVSDRTWEALYRRSRLVPLGACDVRVLGPEDQLRQLCLHLWRHNAFKPRWLCDLGAILESLPADFDWDYCLSGDPLLVDWVVCFLALACRLLGACTTQPAIVRQSNNLPNWLVTAVLWKWGASATRHTLAQCLRRPAELPGVLRYRWLDPIKATFRMRIRPARSLAWVHLLGLLSRPYEVWARLRRLIDMRLARLGPTDPCMLHLRAASRFN